MQFNKHSARRSWAWLFALMLAVTGCGGGGAGAAGAGSTRATADAGGATAVARVKLVADAAVLSSDAKTPVNVSAIATDANNLAVAGATVNFVVKDASNGTRLQVLQGKTDATGTATAILSLLAGSPSNRPITVSAQIGAVANDSLVVNVSGTKLSVSGPNSLVFKGQPARFTATLLDAGGSPLAAQAVAVKSAKGNGLSTAAATTDASGQAFVEVSGTVAGDDTLQFSGAGANAVAPVTVGGDNLTVLPVRPATAGSAPIGTDVAFVVSYAKAGGIPAGTNVALATTRGQLQTSSTDVSGGSAAFSVRSSFAGPATVTATVGGVVATYNLNFIATTPAGVDLQASPSTIGPNAEAGGASRATLVATVRDAAGNPVANRDVSFNAIADPSGGSITPGISRTDFSGRATATFVAGPRTTSTNGVRVRAADVASGTASNEALMTVSSQALFVRIGTNSTLDPGVSDASYRKNFDVLVTDATGNAVANSTVQAQVRSLGYYIGNYVRGTDSWQAAYRTYSPADFGGAAVPPSLTSQQRADDRGEPYYASEDGYSSGVFDGVCQAGEDTNADGQLTPGNVASVPASVTTDQFGRATVGLVYPRSFANWATVRIEVTIRVNGSEGTAAYTYPLEVLSSDVALSGAPPGGVNSPFPFRTDRRTCQ